MPAPQSPRAVTLREVALPDFGMPTQEPIVPAAVYQARIATAQRAATARGLDVLIVYGDREHFANLAYLTAIDPRFEEAMLVLQPGHAPHLTVGNEGWGYAALSPVAHKRHLFQDFSLLGQPRGDSPTLEALLAGAGIAPGVRVGVVGWKYREAPRETIHRDWIELPAYLVDALRAMTGPTGRVENVTDLFMSARNGLRAVNEVDQLAAFEYAACRSSAAVHGVMTGFRIGQTEYEAMRLMRLDGFPLSCHPMLTAGPRAAVGLPSPGTRPIQRGDFMTAALGLWGALTSRCGFVMEDASELPEAIRDYAERLVMPYFRAAVAWLETLRIGASGAEMFAAVHAHIGDPFFGVSLNPGHLIHLDEWMNSPIYQGSDIKLVSGMALQVDIIPATGSAYYTSNIEEGVALADAELREAFAAAYPDAWRRIQARRHYLREQIGITLAPEVLPFSNIPGTLAPFLLKPSTVLTIEPR